MRLNGQIPCKLKKFPANARIAGNLVPETGSIRAASTTIAPGSISGPHRFRGGPGCRRGSAVVRRISRQWRKL